MAQRPQTNEWQPLKHQWNCFFQLRDSSKTSSKRTAIAENGRKPQSIKQHTIVRQIGIALFLKISSESLTTPSNVKSWAKWSWNEWKRKPHSIVLSSGFHERCKILWEKDCQIVNLRFLGHEIRSCRFNQLVGGSHTVSLMTASQSKLSVLRHPKYTRRSIKNQFFNSDS